VDRAFPIRAGFRAVLRQPRIVLAEIAWRWTFGLAAASLVTASVLLYLDTTPVSDVELLALRSRTPWLVADALGHIFRGSGVKLVRMFLILAPALVVLWIAVASLGRGIILQPLFAGAAGPARKSSLLGLHFLRAALGTAALIGYSGAVIIAGSVTSSSPADRLAVFLLVLVLLSLLIATLRSRVGWFLLLATLFAVRDRRDTFAAIAEAVRLFRRRSADFVTLGMVFFVVRLFLFSTAGAFAMVPLLLIGRAPGWLVVGLVVLVALIYFALADFLFIARLAAYVAVAEDDRAQTLAPLPLPVEAPSSSVAPLAAPEPVSS